MKVKLILSSLFFLASCTKYESPIFYFHNVSDRPLKDINCIYKTLKFKFDDIGINTVKLFSFYLSSNEEFYGKMFCRLRNFENKTKNFQFEVSKNDLVLPKKKDIHTKPWMMPLHFFLSVISPIGFGGRDIEFFFQHINIYLSQEGFEVLFTGDKNYFKKDNEYIEIMRINGLNYLQEKLLNKNLNY